MGELRITDLTASFPRGITITLLGFTQRLHNLFSWLQLQAIRVLEGEAQVRFLLFRREATELRRRIDLVAQAAQALKVRLPDPGLPIRWAMWLEQAGETADFPEGHRVRYRQHREQTSTVWTNNQRAFFSTMEHVETLLTSLDTLERKAFAELLCTYLDET